MDYSQFSALGDQATAYGAVLERVSPNADPVLDPHMLDGGVILALVRKNAHMHQR